MYHKRAHRWLAFFIVLLLAATSAGCAEQLLMKLVKKDGEPGVARQDLRREGVDGGTWVEALPRPLMTLDPAFAVSTTEGRVMPLMYDGLVRLTPEGKVVPALAAGWTVSDQGRVYEFQLRPGARFHNGEPVTAADVVYSFRRLLDPGTGSPRAWLLEAVEGAAAFSQGLTRELPGIEAVDDHKVRIHLARPFAPFLELLATPAATIVSAQQPPLGDGGMPVGTGPFRLVEQLEDGSLRLEAFSDYFAGRPHLDEVHLNVMTDPGEKLEAFLDGRLHVLDLTPAMARYVRDELGWTGPLHRITLPVVYYLALNNSKPPLTDPLVRMAVNHAIDREAILSELFGDDYELANGSIPPGLPGYDEDLTGLEYDPDKARQLLQQAGYGDGLRLEAVESTAPIAQAINRRVKEMLAEVGIELNIRTLAQEDFWAAVGGPAGQGSALAQSQAGGDEEQPVPESDLFLLSWSADYPSAENFLYPLFHSTRWGAAGNRARFGSPETDRLLEQLHAVRDRDEEVSLYRQVQRAIFQRHPWVPLFFPVTYQVVRPEVMGYTPPSVYHEQKLWDVWLQDPAPWDGADGESW